MNEKKKMIRNIVPTGPYAPYGNKYIADYARNALLPFPHKDKIIASKYNNNTTNFVFTYGTPVRTKQKYSTYRKLTNPNEIRSWQIKEKLYKIEKMVEKSKNDWP